jgi:cytochrome c
MHFSLLEKFGAALLVSAWLIYGTNFLGNVLVDVEEGEAVAATDVAGQEEAEPAQAPEPEQPFAVLLASAEPSAGEKVFGKCKACHGVDPGGAHKVGPNLHDIVGAPIASKDGFAYSGALADKGGEWTYEELSAFLENPKEYAAGTKMTFAGLKKAEDRAEVIAYLRANTENPPPLPEPPAEPEPAAEGAPAEGAPAEEAPAEGAPAPGEQTEEAPAEGEQAAAAPDAGAPGLAAEQTAADAAGIGALLAAADAEAGAKVFAKCKACHSVEQGGPNKVGPNLWDVVGTDKAAKEGYKYSDALGSLEGEWTYADLDAYLANPREYAPGNKMTFAGLKDPDDRADVILYLRENSEAPPPLP